MQDQTWAKFFCIPKNMHSRTPMPNTQSWLNEEESKKSFTPPVVRGSLWSHSVVEITPKVTLRRKLLGEMTFCHFTCISQCDSIIQERLTNIHSNDGARVIFHTHGWSDFWIKCSERIPELWGKVKLLLLAFPTTYFAEQGFCQVLHKCNKYRNLLDMSKTVGNGRRLKLTNLQNTNCFQKSCRQTPSQSSH